MAETPENTPSEEPKRPRGRPPDPLFSDDEVQQFLELIAAGFGINMACKEMRVTWHRFNRTRLQDPEFAASVERAEEHLSEKHRALMNGIAFRDEGHFEALKFLIGRRDHERRWIAEMAQERELAKDREPITVTVRKAAENKDRARAKADEHRSERRRRETG